jgi:hypothetical protein
MLASRTALFAPVCAAQQRLDAALHNARLQNFGACGPVRHIHIVPAAAIAFIRFHWRASAEFAREAMDQQRLEGSTLHEVCRAGVAWRGVAWRGVAWRGVAWRGVAWRGVA